MDSSAIENVERALGIKLPAEYREFLQSLEIGDLYVPEILSDPGELISSNAHFTDEPEDLSAFREPGLWGALKFKLIFDAKGLVEGRRKNREEWVGAGRFVIGSDLGEERYFIVLSETPSRVHVYNYETGRVTLVSNQLGKWAEQVLSAARSGK